MNKIKISVACIVFSVFTSTVFAQDTENTTLPDIGSYSIFVLNSEIGNNLYFFTQGRLHQYDLFKNAKQYLIRSAIEYKFSKKFKIHLGFASVDKQPFDKNAWTGFEIQRWFYNEYQFTFGSADQLQLKARLRHERRWITPKDQIDTYKKDKLRLQVSLIKNISEKFYANLFSEGFFDVEANQIKNYRNNLSIGTHLNKTLKFEAGVIDEGLGNNKSTFIVSRVFINTSWRSKKNNKENNQVLKEIPLDQKNQLSQLITDDTLATIDESTISTEKEHPEVVIDEGIALEKEVKTTAEQPDTPSTTLRYHLIVAAHQDNTSASKTLERLTRDGYPNGSVLEVNENEYYRVSAQEFNSLEAAEKAKQNLIAIGYKKPWILSTSSSTTAASTYNDKHEAVGQKELKEHQKATTPGMYHLIVSSNKIKKEAETTASYLTEKGYQNTRILPVSLNGYYRVSTDSFLSDSEARKALHKLKTDYPATWILTANSTSISESSTNENSVKNRPAEPKHMLVKVNDSNEDSIYERSSSAIPYYPVHHVISASTKDVAVATHLLEQLRKQGFINAFILETPSDEGAYRISAAHFKNKSDTSQAIELLSKKGHPSAWVLTINN